MKKPKGFDLPAPKVDWEAHKHKPNARLDELENAIEKVTEDDITWAIDELTNQASHLRDKMTNLVQDTILIRCAQLDHYRLGKIISILKKAQNKLVELSGNA